MRLFKRQARHIGLQELSDLIDGRVVGTRKEQVEEHLESCDSCREVLEGLRYSVGLLQQAPMLAPRRRLVMQEAPTPVVARPMVMSWAYGAAASVAVLLAVVLGADLMGALPGGGTDFAAEESAFSDAPFESEVALEADVAESDDAGVQDVPLVEAQLAAKTLPDEPMEEGTPDAATAARSVADVPAEPEGDEGTHMLWRALEGVLAASLALILGLVLWRIRRSRRAAP